MNRASLLSNDDYRPRIKLGDLIGALRNLTTLQFYVCLPLRSEEGAVNDTMPEVPNALGNVSMTLLRLSSPFGRSGALANETK